MQPYSLYLHIPFCWHRCAYCDFNTYAGLDHLISDYVTALCREIEFIAIGADQRLPIHTVFFGGGTPSLLPAADIDQIMRTIEQNFILSPESEITLEANPGTVSFEYWSELRQTGINRLSLGLQSANADDLRLLERQHDYSDAVQAVRWAREAGFNNINLDLIYGLPYQTIERWQRTLELVLGLKVEHLSLYALSLEHGTPMHKWVNRGLLPEPDAATIAV
jgi:oxygen-independent coproporphyrinogen-3 oxidase